MNTIMQVVKHKLGKIAKNGGKKMVQTSFGYYCHNCRRYAEHCECSEEERDWEEC